MSTTVSQPMQPSSSVPVPASSASASNVSQETQGGKGDSFNELVSLIRKRVQEAHKAHPGIGVAVELKREDVVNAIPTGQDIFNTLLEDSNMQEQLKERMSLYDLKMERIKQGKEGAEVFKFSLEAEEGSQEEGEERFELHPEEEEGEEETTRPGPSAGIPLVLPQRVGGPSGPVTAPRGARFAPRGRTPPSSLQAQRGRPRPRPEGLRNVEITNVHSFREVLQAISVQRLAYDNWIRKRLVLVGKKQPIERALSRINTHNILSLPVVDEDSSSGAVVGILDILDIIASVSDNIDTIKPKKNVLFTSIGEVMQRERRPTYLTNAGTSLYDVIHHFAQHGIHRVLVVDRPTEAHVVEQTNPEEHVVGLLTQSDLIRFVAENFMWMKREPIFQKTLGELGLGSRKPVTVDTQMLAYKVFMEIHKNCKEGVAMVDGSGKILANVSASNIKGMTRRNYQLLFRPIIQYLSRDRKRGWWQLPICTSYDTKLENVVLQFVVAKVHRMYITDNDGRPVGEISLTDVMAQLKDL